MFLELDQKTKLRCFNRASLKNYFPLHNKAKIDVVVP